MITMVGILPPPGFARQQPPLSFPLSQVMTMAF
jgi:hypothetical protein